MRPWTGILAACAAGLARAVLAAGPAPATAPDLVDSFPRIRQQLASSEYQERETGQKELDKLPPTLLEPLRALAAKEADPEVKARIEERLDAMELYGLTHPAPLSVRWANATLAEVAADLNAQLGDALILPVAGPGKYTLAADNQSFWDIINQLNRQSPLNVASSLTVSSGMTRYVLRLQQLAAAPPTYNLIDTFAVTPQISGQPATGNWMMLVRGFSDPRVRVMQYSQLRLEKITDQDGNSLLPLVLTNSTAMINSIRPMIAWSSYATLNAAPTVTRIKELRASIALSLLEKETTVAIDLSKEAAPIDGPHGKITVEQIPAANGTFMLRITASTAAANSPPVSTLARSLPLTIRVLDKDGKVLQNTLAIQSTFSGVTQIGMPAQVAAGSPSKVELTWPDKTRDMVLHVELQDIEIPAALPVVQPLPGVLPIPAIKPLVLPQ